MSYKITTADFEAISRFQEAYPTWWFRVGVCDLTRDFTCAPQAISPEAAKIKIGNIWDEGFSCDHRGSIADAIEDVMGQIEGGVQAIINHQGVEHE